MRAAAGIGIGVILLIAVAGYVFIERPRDAPLMGVSDLQSQRFSGPESATYPTTEGPFAELHVEVTIDTTGGVIAATVQGDDGFNLDPAPGLAAAKLWRFKPQQFDGKPIKAIGVIRIDYIPPEHPPDATVSFPSASPADTELALMRTPCLGSCPDYLLKIRGDGTVLFTAPGHDTEEIRSDYGEYGVLLPGVHNAHVDPMAVQSLTERFRAARFFGLKDEYIAKITDQSFYALMLRVGNEEKHVADYAGYYVGMPASVTELENSIDALARTDRWVRGNLETISDLEAENFDFHSERAVQLASAAAAEPDYGDDHHDVEAMLGAMIDRGLPLDAQTKIKDKVATQSLGSVLLLRSARMGDESLFRRLTDKGYLSTLSQPDLTDVFAAGSGCSPKIAEAIAKAGADVSASGRNGTVWSEFTGYWRACRLLDESRLLDMARTLIRLGVPVDGRDNLGWTPLLSCNSPTLARLLLEHGADPNAQAIDGTTPLLATRDDRVALILLRAGANPNMSDKDGSVRQHAVMRNMPAALTWLNEHGIN